MEVILPPKISLEEFTDRLATLPKGNLEVIDLSTYTSARNPVRVVCKLHGESFVEAKRLLGGSLCKACHIDSMKKPYFEYIKSFSEIHGDKYTYPQDFELINSHQPVPIICKVHGTFYQRIHKHLLGRGCPRCTQDLRPNLQTYVDICAAKYGPEYTVEAVGTYKTVRSILRLNCPHHGPSEKKAKKFLEGSFGCPGCVNDSQRKTKEEFLSRCKEVHGDRYDYSHTVYEQANSPVKVICSQHGAFLITPSKHYSGRGCPKCSIEGRSPYNLTIVERNKEEFLKIASGVYFIKIFNTEDCYFKVGISKDLKTRLQHIKSSSGMEVELLVYRRFNLYEAVILEEFILSSFDRSPSQVKFSGYTECINMVNEEQIKQAITLILETANSATNIENKSLVLLEHRKETGERVYFDMNTNRAFIEHE